MNEYIREITGEDFSAKDIRTWTGTMLSAAALRELGPARTARSAKTNFLQAVDLVAGQLNNTRAVCRKYYVHPALYDAYEDGTFHRRYWTAARRGRRDGLSREEAALLGFLRSYVKLAA